MDTSLNEIWKEIPGYEGLYQVSNVGNVKSLPKKWKMGRWGHKPSIYITKEKILTKAKYKQGYTYVVLNKDKNPVKWKIHRLVALAFIPNPENKRQVNHLNCIRDDNRVENLEWATHSENMKHKFKMGRQSNAGGNNAMAKMVFNTRTGVIYGSIVEAAWQIDIKPGALGDMLKGRVKNRTHFIYA